MTKVNRKRAASDPRKGKDRKVRGGAPGQGALPGGQSAPAEAPARRNAEGEAAEFRWKHNGLRHSFISYRVATTKNVAEVALEAGNSPAVIFSNYRELVTPQDAQAWFAITPESLKAAREKAEQERQAKILTFPGMVAA